MPTFHHDGIDFRYEERGSGIPFIFQHGLGGDILQPLSLFNPPEGIRLICMDARGHGESVPTGDPKKLRFTTMTADVVALADHLQIRRAVFGGISMGAGIALHAALHYPDKVLGLVMVRPAWTDRPNPWTVAMFALVARLIREHGTERGKGVFRQMEEYQNLMLESQDNAAALELQFESPRAVDAVARLEEIPKDAPNHDSAEWKKIQIPTLVLGCRQDPIHPFEYGRILAQHIPLATFEEVTPKSLSLIQYGADTQKAIHQFLMFHYLMP